MAGHADCLVDISQQVYPVEDGYQGAEYVSLSHSVRELLPMKIIIKEVIENLGIDSEKLKFVSRSTIYEDNNGDIVVATSPVITPKSKHIAVKYH